jgi:D-alanyl-D-alanine endopeptidase (penicillin-binding protein 7)
MRVISVDIKSFFFFIKMLFFVSFIGVLWYVFLPTQHFFFTQNVQNEKVHTSNSLQNKEEEPVSGALSVLAHQGTYVVVDMTNMSVTTYDSEYVLESFEILSVPSDISPLVASEGTYVVDEKGIAEVSAVGMVRFPYFVTFGDTYAMHGTPTDAEGVPLEEGYVGGQIELAVEDARSVYEFVEVGTPVYIRTHPASGERAVPATLSVEYKELPATSAQAYALTDVSSGQTFLSKNGNDRYPIASITKLVTAAVATDVIGHGAEVMAPDGEYYTLSDLYYPLLLRSDNKVAKTIALYAGEEYFMGNMQAYVKALGMEKTSFFDSSGLSPKNISTALDLSIFARHLYAEKSYLLDMTKEERVTITSAKGVDWSVTNQNMLASDPYFYGGKLGYTDEAGQTALSLFTIPIAGEVRVLAVVILNSKDWKQDTRTLVRWLEEHAKE